MSNSLLQGGCVNYGVHPAALLFPMMGEDELGKLADDIAANGLMEPVVLYHGQILDGRNRLAACTLADVEPRFVEVDGDLPSATIYVLSKNLHRRHLSISQCGAIGAEAVPLLQEEAKKRQGRRNDLSATATLGSKEPEVHGKATLIAAKELGIGDETVKRALKVKRENPELFEKIKSGEITARAAANSLKPAIAKEPKKTKAVSVPYDPKTDHQKKLAEGQKERMIRALSTITGLCRGLAEMDVRKAVAACYEEERAEWVDRAKDLSSQLRTFAGKLQKGF